MVSATDIQNFEYVVETVQLAPICFGSKLPRYTSPIGPGLSSFQNRVTPEISSKTGPGRYNTEQFTSSIYQQLNKVRSKKGIGSMVGKDERFKDTYVKTPSPYTYNIKSEWDEAKRGTAPFGTKSKIREIAINKNPGPGVYDLSKKKCKHLQLSREYTKDPIPLDAETKCTQNPADYCTKCNELCILDYWHHEHTLFLCHPCWLEEKAWHEIYTSAKLKQFVKIRNCDFVHRHEGTTAAILKHPPHYLRKKINLLNYLNLYIKCK